MVEKARLETALKVVRAATEEWVRVGFFQRGVLLRLDQWMAGLPDDRDGLAQAIGDMAGKMRSNTGADINGVALDESAKPSLESLVLHCSARDETLFSHSAINAADRNSLCMEGQSMSVPGHEKAKNVKLRAKLPLLIVSFEWPYSS